jgi:hypothetical protein
MKISPFGRDSASKKVLADIWMQFSIFLLPLQSEKMNFSLLYDDKDNISG